MALASFVAAIAVPLATPKRAAPSRLPRHAAHGGVLPMLMAWLFVGEDPTMRPRRIAAMLMGEAVLSPGERFGAAATATAALIISDSRSSTAS